MNKLIQQITSFILPLTVLIIIPLLIEKDFTIKLLTSFIAGLVLMIIGLSVMTLTISGFIRIGRGTLAPWSPTRKLVTSGMYAYVRNPMILGVLIVLLGESLSILSSSILILAIFFFIVNNFWFLVYEEPDLQRKFGDLYKNYKKNVPRWIPRLKPWIPKE
ncbi:MAG: isoprenylcysteine carboxylmethyltransferase family protein [Bacteroidales bacterium]|jgi:protein-S-isoprenylcysteine O-methyltransferase Ste14